MHRESSTALTESTVLTAPTAPAASTARNRPLYLPGADVAGTGRTALLCDRDGVVIENRADYVRRREHVRLLPGAVSALRRATSAGAAVVLVSNQSPVGRGLLTEEQVVAVHRFLLDMLAAAGVTVTGSYLCPHAPQDGCGCRKPQPGMIHAAVERFGLDTSRTVFVGDAVEDMLAAHRAGVRGVLVRTGRGAEHARRLTGHPELAGTRVVADLADAVAAWEPPPEGTG